MLDHSIFTGWVVLMKLRRCAVPSVIRYIIQRIFKTAQPRLIYVIAVIRRYEEKCSSPILIPYKMRSSPVVTVINNMVMPVRHNWSALH